MSQPREIFETYYKMLLGIYNSTLNILIQLENHNLNEALEIQKKTQELIQKTEPLLHEINPQRIGLDEQAKAWIEKTTALHYKIELLTQRCQTLISDFKKEIQVKLKQLQTARRLNESQQHEQQIPLARI